MRIPTADATINVIELGEGDATIVLVHGLGGSSQSWQPTASQLARHYHVLVPDLRGCGLSERGRTDYSLSLLADDIMEVIETGAKGPVCLVGHSLGGVVVQTVLAAKPNGWLAAVLASTSSRVSAAASLNWKRLADLVEVKGLSDKPKAQARAFSEIYAEQNPDVLAHMAAQTRTVIKSVYADQARAAASYDFTDALAAVKTPVLVLQGLADRMTPPGGSVILHRALRNSQLKMIDGVGHNLHIELGEKFTELIADFVSDCLARRE